MLQSSTAFTWPQSEYATILEVRLDFHPLVFISNQSFVFQPFGRINMLRFRLVPSRIFHTCSFSLGLVVSWCTEQNKILSELGRFCRMKQMVEKSSMKRMKQGKSTEGQLVPMIGFASVISGHHEFWASETAK